jgi:DNA helicase HerA-like ATPase
MSTFRFGGLSIDVSAYGSQGSAVLGIRDSGKTYTATELAEHLFEAGIPFIAFDPIGVWRYLRVPGKGRGYPIVVAGGQAGDLPLTVASAPEYVRQELAEASGYTHVQSTGFVKVLGRLKKLGFVGYPASGQVVAQPVLFLEGRG